MKKTMLGISIALLGVLSVGAIAANKANSALWLGAATNENLYGVQLDATNAYQDDEETKQITTLSGSWEIGFVYEDCYGYDGAHALMDSYATIKNTTPISAVTSLRASFIGPLEFRYSFDGVDWSEYTIAKSGKDFYFQNEPAYIELTANQHMVLLESLLITYACENPTDQLEYVDKSYTLTIEDLPTTSKTTVTGPEGFDLYSFGLYSNGTNIVWPTSVETQTSFNGFLILATPLKLKSISVDIVKTMNRKDVYYQGVLYSGTELEDRTHSTTISAAGTYNIPEGDTYFLMSCTTSGKNVVPLLRSITITYQVPAIDPVGIDALPTDYEIVPGMFRQMFIDYYPSTTNRNKEVTWTTSDANVATISNDGFVAVSENAVPGTQFTITATSTWNPSLTSTATFTVVEEKESEWTIMVYMCGADLESQGYYASYDILEMCDVNRIPDDVNIFILTGGASAWGISGIPANQNLILTLGYDDEKDETDLYLAYNGFSEYMSMDDPNTLYRFMAMCINSAPAKHYGLIIWDHGGAMQGCCFDENVTNSDGLTNSETAAVFDALQENGYIEGNMDFIGYDCCLMAVQDIVIYNSLYFDYMVASEESEAGYGWDYDQWLDDLYMNKPTEEICRAICDTFIKDNDMPDCYGPNEMNDQTLSYFDLYYAGQYYTAFENFAEAWKAKLDADGVSKTTVSNFFKNNVQTYGVDSSNSQLRFGVFDVYHFLICLIQNSTLCPDQSLIIAVANAFDDLVAYSNCGYGAGASYGMTLFYAVSANAQQTVYYDEYETAFTNWLAFNRAYGL